MQTRPIQPAHIVFGGDFGGDPGAPPSAPDFGDFYPPRQSALVRARHVFLQGNGLPQRWAGRERFVILETGFGLGNNFLATWQAWRQDPARCQRLHIVAVELHPPSRDDLARAHEASPLPELAAALVQAWPPLTPNLHLLDFDAGRVQLTLALGDVQTLLPGLRLTADAIYLDGVAPARNAQMWTPQVLKAVGRMATDGATVATWSVARDVQAGLVAAGFEVRTAPGEGGQPEFTVAQYLPRFAPRRLPDPAVPARDAVVVGAGLAGAAAAHALARLGLQVTVLEQDRGAAMAASGNPAGIFHGTVNADDGRYARLYRAAALAAADTYRAALSSGRVAGQVDGLLRLAALDEGSGRLQDLLQRSGLPSSYVELLDAAMASSRAGVPLSGPCWHYPGGGWLSPPDWVHEALRAPGVTLHPGTAVQTLVRDGAAWQLQNEAGSLLARASLVVLCNGQGASPLVRNLQLSPWPLVQSRGQVTHWLLDRPSPLRLPVAGEGYAVPLVGGLLCGATRQEGDEDAAVRETDHLHNVSRLRQLCGLQPPDGPSAWRGRVGWRLHADDRLPVAGALPAATMAAGQRLDQARLLPRETGLFVLTALGARGLTLAPLLGRLVAAMATGAPWPLDQDLVDAVDPGRWTVRAARRAQAQAG